MVDSGPNFDRIAFVRGESMERCSGSTQTDTTVIRFAYQVTKTPMGYDWESDRELLSQLAETSGVIFEGFSLADVDSVFRLRALQLAGGETSLDIAAVIFISEGPVGQPIPPGLRQRILYSWPFCSVLFVADGDTAAALTEEGLPVISLAEAQGRGMRGLLTHSEARRVSVPPYQAIG